jgi:protein-tyrosine phosphatase
MSSTDVKAFWADLSSNYTDINIHKHFYFDPMTYKFIPLQRPNPDFIINGLYLGSRENAYTPKIISRYRITHVLSVCMVDDMSFHKAQFAHNVKLKVIPILDEENVNIKYYFHRAIDFINEGIDAGGNVLVHCVWGMSRSATIVMAYLMNRCGVDFPEAYNFVRISRPIVSPNKGFIRQLMEYSDELFSVEFSIHYQTKFGENLHLVGNLPELGNWIPTDYNRMKWCDSGLWEITKQLFRKNFLYKYVVVNSEGHIIWETCGNRSYMGSHKYLHDYWCWGNPGSPTPPS